MTDDLTALEARLRAGVAPARDLLAAALRPAPAARDLAALVALGADEAQALLEALLGDRDVAAAALEETLALAAERLDAGEALDLVDLLGLARERGVVARRLLDGKVRAPAAPAPAPDDRAALLLARGLGLGPHDLARAGVRDVEGALARAAGASAEVPIVAAPGDVLARVGARRAAAARITAVQRATPDERLRCTYCHGGLSPRRSRRCAGCLAPHHEDCFLEHGRCAAPGCGERRVLRQATGPAWWRGRATIAAGALALVGLAALGLSRSVDAPVDMPVVDAPLDTRPSTPVTVVSKVTERPAPAPLPPGPSELERELAAIRARMSALAPDWSAISLELLAMERRYPGDLGELRALRDDCARELRDEDLYQQAVDIVAVRDVERYPDAVRHLEKIDRASRIYPDARAYLAWIDADVKIREAERAYELGDATAAFKLLNEALQHEELGQEPRQSIRTRRQRWGRVFTAFTRGMELSNEGRAREAREELERVLQLEPDPSNTFHRRALEQVQHLEQRESLSLERSLRQGLDALQSAEYDAAYRFFGDVQRDPAVTPGDLQRVQDAVVEAERSRRLLSSARQDFLRDRQERFLEIFYTTKLLRRWLPPGKERTDAEKLYQDVQKRLKVLQRIQGVDDER